MAWRSEILLRGHFSKSLKDIRTDPDHPFNDLTKFSDEELNLAGIDKNNTDLFENQKIYYRGAMMIVNTADVDLTDGILKNLLSKFRKKLATYMTDKNERMRNQVTYRVFFHTFLDIGKAYVETNQEHRLDWFHQEIIYHVYYDYEFNKNVIGLRASFETILKSGFLARLQNRFPSISGPGDEFREGFGLFLIGQIISS